MGTVTGSHSALENRPDPPHQGLECPGVQDTRSPHWGSATCPQPFETLTWGTRGGPEGAGRPPGPRLSLSWVGRASRYPAARPAARLCWDGPQDALLRPVRALLLLRGFWGAPGDIEGDCPSVSKVRKGLNGGQSLLSLQTAGRKPGPLATPCPQ